MHATKLMTFHELEVIYHTAAGAAVEGYEIEIYSRRWLRDTISKKIDNLAFLATDGRYTPRRAWMQWQDIADISELCYSAPALAPDMPGFKPAMFHNIGVNGRRMAALYMERRWRQEVFKRAGVEMPTDLIADCDPEEV